MTTLQSEILMIFFYHTHSQHAFGGNSGFFCNFFAHEVSGNNFLGYLHTLVILNKNYSAYGVKSLVWLLTKSVLN